MKKAIAILSALFLLTQGTAMADREGRGRIDRGTMAGYGNSYGRSSLIANPKLKLTAEQTTQLRALDEKFAQEIAPIREQLYGKGRELKSEWLQTEPDRGKIEALQRETAKLQEQMRAKLATHHADVLQVLTPEQQAQVLDDGHGRVFDNKYKRAGFGWQKEWR